MKIMNYELDMTKKIVVVTCLMWRR